MTRFETLMRCARLAGHTRLADDLAHEPEQRHVSVVGRPRPAYAAASNTPNSACGRFGGRWQIIGAFGQVRTSPSNDLSTWRMSIDGASERDERLTPRLRTNTDVATARVDPRIDPTLIRQSLCLACKLRLSP